MSVSIGPASSRWPCDASSRARLVVARNSHHLAFCSRAKSIAARKLCSASFEGVGNFVFVSHTKKPVRAATVLVVKREGCPQGPQAVGFLERSRLWSCGQLCALKRRDMAASRQFSF